jgi:4-amino-4-deoxy-L-arabinose transferase-like glycosyltransferase
VEAVQAEPRSGATRALAAALLLLAAMVWMEPAGSGLAEPDETRYAEIPREMLAAGDLVVPRLNGVPYFEKPPLLHWLNAASLRLFGETSWAARLPTRLAGMGTVLLIILAARRRGGGGLPAGIFFLAAPMGFLFSRANLTDGLLTFGFTATLLAGRAAVLRREAGRPWAAISAAAGAAAAAGFLTKGLVAIVLPGAILLLWALATRRIPILLRTLVLSPAPVVFAALAAPWFLAVERRHPGFLDFFFVGEHLRRFATGAAKRPGGIEYFVPVFFLGFLPGLPFFVAGVARALRRRKEDEGGLFVLLWFGVVFVFFSLSRSKLPPYLLPAIPAAALLAARGAEENGHARRLWIVQACLATALAAGLLVQPELRGAARALRLEGLVAPALALLVVAAWLAVLLAARSRTAALTSLAVAWTSFYAAVALGWPKTPQARLSTELAEAARSAGAGRIPVVAYRNYVNGLSWELKSPIPVADFRGELEPEFESRSAVREALFWTKEKFWAQWRSRPLIALVRLKDLVPLMTATPPARVVRYSGRYAIVANFPEGSP